MLSKFNVVYTGLQKDTTDEEFIEKFCSKFGLSEQKVRQIVSSKSDVVVKKDLAEDKAEQYAAAFEACGMVVRLDEIATTVETVSGLSLAPMEENQESDSVVPAATDKVEIEADKGSSLEQQSNPYATPSASLEKNIVSKDGQGSLEGGINGDYDFTIGEIFSEAWERTKGAKGSFLLAWLFYIVMAIALNAAFAYFGPDPELLISQERFGEGMFWSFIPSFVGIPILYPVLAGIVLMGIHRSVDADINAVSVFGHYGKVIPLGILGILIFIFIMLGFMLLIIPGIYLAIAYMMAMSLMIDRDMGAWEAMETSRKAVSKHWFKIFFLYVLVWFSMIAAILPFFIGLTWFGPLLMTSLIWILPLLLIGLIWALPLISIIHGVLYKYMFGVESVE